ncbi:DUF1684 domain-containing protein [Kribbella monticola]|uniref:DUF1684 domain-containing protein n=1 Tax=Kribbella monticola TaxID=2185285 RepID=UPI000DD40C68|nr:DUF1684 domain-containing protein [Kribbella monticola]
MSYESEWQLWHVAREQELSSDYGWLSITAFDWLGTTPAELPGLPGKWWTAEGVAHVEATGLTLDGQPLLGAASASAAEAGSLSWLYYGDKLAELVLRGGRYAIRQRDPKAATRIGFNGVPAYPVNPRWKVTGYFTPFSEPERVEVATARPDLRQHVTAVGTVHVALGESAYELVATAAGDGLALSFHDETNGVETARWRTLTIGPVQGDGSVALDFNRTVNLPYAFTDYGTCPAPVAGNRLALPVTAGEKVPR